MTQRQSATIWLSLCITILITIILAPSFFGQTGLDANFSALNLAPSLRHPFGTDHLGRDLLARSFHALSVSLWIGIFAACLSLTVATLIALCTALGPRADKLAAFIMDIMLSMPHLMVLILICFALGGGAKAVVIAIALSHWPQLARLLRAEVLQLRQARFIEASLAFGKSPLFVIKSHILPHLLPQMLIGFVLMFPHAILHEAGLSFLGFGLEPSHPAIGLMLADAMRYIGAGRWWLAAFPGLMLLIMVLTFAILAQALTRLLSPRVAQC